MSEIIPEIVPSSTPVLVIGATGYLGRHVLAYLRKLGYPVRILVRDPARLSTEQKQGVEVFVGQVTRPETLHGLCDGISIVISTLGLRSLARKPTPWEVDYQGNLNVLTCAQAAGVKHFIFVGVLHAATLRAIIPVLEPRERFVDVLRQSGLTWTVIGATGAFNDMQMIFQLAHRGRVFLIGTGEAQINPIHPTDIAREVARCIVDADARNRSYDIGGPETFTYTQVAHMAFQVLGTSPRITHIAPWLVDGVAQMLRPFNPTAAGFLTFFRQVLTRDMVGAATGQIHLHDIFVQLAKQSQETHKGAF